MRARGRRLARAGVGIFAVMVVTAAVVMAAAAAAGYRPVVLTSGSMGDYAPPGSVVIASPESSVEVGDVLVMRRDDGPTITHRVIEIQYHDGAPFAITKGDANEDADVAPYALGDSELVGREVIPRVGGLLLAADDPVAALAVVALALIFINISLLRWIWQPAASPPPAAPPPPTAPAPVDRRQHGREERAKGRRRLAALVVGGVGLFGGGVAWAVYAGTDSVTGNVFATRDCFDSQLASVQHGQTISSVDGIQNITITAVDPTAAFVLLSTRSAANEPADAMIQAHLASPTTIELTRRTDAVAPPPIIVEWSVVEYGCGVTVQRGVTVGNGGATLDIPITESPTDTSFVLLSSVGSAADTDFDGRAMAISELTSSTNLRLRSAAPGGLAAANSYAWQVVGFDDPTDVRVQTATTTLTAGSQQLPISAVDPESTFVLATATTASAGADIGERLLRAHLDSPTEVEIHREIATGSMDVHVQVVELREGSVVHHGTVDFDAGQPTRTLVVDPVDPARTTALGTVQIPGAVSGGASPMTADDIVGEASATFELSDPSTVTVTRDATSAEATFGWQLIEWGGPQWWTNPSPFRQRIDVTASAAAAPGGYSTPLVFDHAALVAAGLSDPTGDDLRIVHWDGTAWAELDRILDEASAWDAVDTTLWFRTTGPIDADSTSSYWMYFGDPAPAPPLADAENVWLLTEDFESGTLGDFEDRTDGTAWYQAAAWTRRIPLTIAAGTVDADLADFPLLVEVTSSALGATARPDGDDIRFVAADGFTPLRHEIESWDPTTGRLTAWVRVPSVSATAATTVHLLFGAADAPGQSDVRGTWGDPVAATWHLHRDPSGPGPQADDATVWNRDGVSVGTMSGADLVAGIAGSAIDFDGSDDRFDIGSWDLGLLPEATVSGWVNLDDTSGDGVVFAQSDGTIDVVELAHQGSEARARLHLDGVDHEVTGGVLSPGSWHHLSAAWDGTFLRLFVDGAPVGSVIARGTLASATSGVTIGDIAGGGRSLDGRIDEVRLESVARSEPWVRAVAANQRDAAGFAVAGAVQSGSWLGQGSWSLRKPLTVDHDQIAGPLADQTLLVEFTDAELAANAQGDGDDIVFTAADGVTRLDHQIESWSTATGELTAWVRVPALDDTTDTQLFVYYGNGAARNQQDPEGTHGPAADLVHLGDS